MSGSKTRNRTEITNGHSQKQKTSGEVNVLESDRDLKRRMTGQLEVSSQY